MNKLSQSEKFQQFLSKILPKLTMRSENNFTAHLKYND